jgi:hypothetical protein
MQDAPEADRARNDAFRKIGRNIYFFQLIEAALKHLVIHGDVEGYVSELSAVVEQKSKKIARQPMGQLVDNFIRGTYQSAPANRDGPDDLREAWFSFKYRVEADPEFLRARKRALRLLVKERNDLIHRQLPEILPTSTERWLELSAFLDAQRERLVAEFEGLRSMIRGLTDARNDALLELDKALAAAHAGDPASPQNV